MSPSFKTLFASMALALAGGAVLAQPAPTGAASTPRIDQRQANQDKRIDQGVASGQLTPRETRKLEREQAAINRSENKAKADGVVTAGERRHLTKMQDAAGRDIRRQKHDVQHRPGAASGVKP
jgi:hypothetical protein